MAIASLAFLLAYTTGLLLALFRNPIFGLYTYVAVFYLHPPSRWWGQFMPEARWALIAALVTLIATWRMPALPDRRSWREFGGIQLYLWFVIWVWFQLFWSISGGLHGEAVILFTKYAILLFLMYRLLVDWPAVRGFAAAHVLGCLYLGWLALLAPPWGRLEGVGGPGIDEANSLAMQLGTGLIFAVALLVEGKWIYKLLALAATPLIVNGIVQTESRGAIVGLVVAGFVMLFMSAKRDRRFLIICSLIGVVLLIRVAPDNFIERMTSTVSAVEEPQELDASAAGRLVLFKAQWQMFLDYPMGTGHRGTAILSQRYLDQKYLAANTLNDREGGSRSSHNLLMSLLVEHGLPGLLLYIALLIWVLRSLLRLRSLSPDTVSRQMEVYRMVIAGALASVLTAGMFADYLKSEVLYWCIALVCVLSELAKQENPVVDLKVQQRRHHPATQPIVQRHEKL